MSHTPRTLVDQLPPVYTSQFLLTISPECLLVEASAGATSGEAAHGPELPIHSRMAVPWPAARRLAAVLQKAIGQHDLQASGSTPSTPPLTMPEAAQLPRLEV